MNSIKRLFNKYKTIIAYIFSSGISFVVDIVAFTIIMLFIKNIIISSFLARAISSIINYLINKYKVFKYNKNSKNKSTMIQYFALVIINITISSILVSWIYSITKINATIIKTIIDTLIFISNYYIQKIFIFKDNPNVIKIKRYILPLISFLAMAIKLNTNGILFNYNLYEIFVLFLSLFIIYFLYNKVFNLDNANNFNVLSIIFTIFMIVGYSYHNTYTSALIYSTEVHILVTLIKFIGYYFLIKYILNCLYDFICKGKFKDTKHIISSVVDKHPFLTTLVVLSIIYGFYLLAFYPGIINYDNANQIKEVLGIHNRYLDSVIIINPNITLTNFNPILHTLLLGNLFKLGVSINNVNFGIFLYTIIQLVVAILVLSYSIYFLHKEGIKVRYLIMVILIYILLPFYPLYAITAVKDSYWTFFFILYLIKLYQFIKYKYKLKDYIIFTLIIFLLILFRNNGVVVVLCSLPLCMFISKKYIKPSLILLLISVIFGIGYTKVLKFAEIPNTSVRETLSVPFQQTARYVKDYPTDVTEYEKATIDKILNYETIAKRYVPTLSDKVKNEYNIYTTKEDLTNYFKVWFEMFLKHPNAYINATISNNYGYFYPDSYSWYVYTNLNTKLKEAGYNYHFNNLLKERLVLKGEAISLTKIPILCLLVSCGFYTWLYLFLANVLFKKNKLVLLILLMPAFSMILMCLIGPANTYFRYVLPYAATAPILILLIIKSINKNICR